MNAIIKLQLITVMSLAIFCGVFWGVQAAFSLFLGGLVYILPTFLAVLILKFLQPYPTLAGSGFIAAESLKIILAFILMTAIMALYREVRFLPFFLGLLSVSHLVFLYYLKVHRYGK